MKRILILLTFTLIMSFGITTEAFATEYTIFNGETVNVSKEGNTTYTSGNEMIAKVSKDGIVKGVSRGETQIEIKTKKLFRKADKETIDITVVNGADIRVESIGETPLEPVFDLYDTSKKPIKEFGLGETVKVIPGTYYLKEETKFSSISDGYSKVELMVGEPKTIATTFTNVTKLDFTTTDKTLEGKEITIWNRNGDRYIKQEKATVKDGKTDKITIRSGNYYWSEPSGEIKPPNHGKAVMVDKDTKGYPFSVLENPLTVQICSTESAENYVAVENITINENTTGNMQKIYSDLTGLYGFSDISACAVIGNMYGESGVRTSALENGGGGHGLCQWTGGRWNNLQEFAKSQGKPWTDIEVQIDFLVKELDSMKMDAFWGAETVEEATEIFMRKFERPAEFVYATSLPKRIGAAQKAMDMFGNR